MPKGICCTFLAAAAVAALEVEALPSIKLVPAGSGGANVCEDSELSSSRGPPGDDGEPLPETVVGCWGGGPEGEPAGTGPILVEHGSSW